MKTKCEVYSRVVGYIRPVQQWNEGKQAEFHRRKTFDSTKALEKCDCEEKVIPQAIEIKTV